MAGKQESQMTFTIGTWNVNSVRVRHELVVRLLEEMKPDILCLQELKAPTEFVDTDGFVELGYRHVLVRGQKAFNGVAVISRLPLTCNGSMDFLGKVESRHMSVHLESGIAIENFYVPAGGYVPDRDTNPKFGDKLDFVREMRDWSRRAQPKRTVLVGDLNIAPLENDVWSHKQLLSVVSHTPEEVNGFSELQEAGGWVDITRKDIPDGKLYSWWSYRSPNWDLADKGRRLDHIWATRDIAQAGHSSWIARDVRGWDRPSDHAPVFATFDL